MSKIRFGLIGLLILLILGGFSTVHAIVSPDEAAKLGNELTPFGSEKAGNEEGTIPAWDGGLTGPPAGVTHEPGDFYKNPFKGDKSRLTITSKNYKEFEDKLSEGLTKMFQKFPDFRMQVYPTRRTHAVPEQVAENTKLNATRVRLNAEKLGYSGGYGGYPFPIPKSGEELTFNHNVRFQGASSKRPYNHYKVYEDGKPQVSAGAETWEIYPYYQPDGSPENFNGFYQMGIYLYTYPERRRGEVIISRDPVNQPAESRQAWQYLPGQRRVRRAPSVGYDTPNPSSGGIYGYDEGYMFYGPIDKFSWKILGKKEMFIPYNNYDFTLASPEEVLQSNFPNPDLVRFELHRVWVLEATAIERHQYSKQVFYVDEDSWTIGLADRYDSRGNLWRWGYAVSYNFYDLPAVVLVSMVHWDDTTNFYATQFMPNGLPQMWQTYKENIFPPGTFEPENVRALGRR